MSRRQKTLLATVLLATLPMRQWVANNLLSGIHLNTDLSFGENSISLQNDKIAFSSDASPTAEGEFAWDSTAKKLIWHDGGGEKVVPREDLVLLLSGAQAMTGNLNLNNNKVVSSAAPSSSGDLANKSYIDAAVAGLSGITYVHLGGYLGNRTVTQIDALSPASGWTVVATDSGTPAAGSSDALSAGDVAQYNGTSWLKLIPNAGGFVPNTTKLVALKGDLVAPLTDAADENKFCTFDGTSNTPALVSPGDGASYMVRGEGAANEGAFYAFDLGAGTVDAGTWAIYGGPGLDHALLANGAAGDQHTQYAFLNGRNGGQTLAGGSATSDTLQLKATSNATVGSGSVQVMHLAQFDANMVMNGDKDFTPITSNQGRLGTSSAKWKEVHAALLVQEDGVYTGNGFQYRLQETDYGFRLLDQTGTGAAIGDRETGTPYRMLRMREDAGMLRRAAVRMLLGA